MKFIDKLDLYFPHIVKQFEQTITGMEKTPKKGRRSATCNFLGRLSLLPLDIPVRSFLNGSRLILLVTLTPIRIIAQTATKRSTFTESLVNHITMIADLGLVTLASPIQPIAKLTRIFIGICSPKTLYKDPDNLMLRMQENIFFKRRPELENLKANSDIDNQANIILLTAIINWAESQAWQLHDKGNHFNSSYSPDYKTLIVLPPQRTSQARDDIKKEYILFKELQKVLKKWNNDETSISSESIVNMIQKLPAESKNEIIQLVQKKDLGKEILLNYTIDEDKKDDLEEATKKNRKAIVNKLEKQVTVFSFSD